MAGGMHVSRQAVFNDRYEPNDIPQKFSQLRIAVSYQFNMFFLL
jgi:hypothetical protein